MGTLIKCAPCWGVAEIVQTDAYITEIMHARQLRCFASYAHGYDKALRLRANILQICARSTICQEIRVLSIDD